ncbi:hypothetical protein FUT79_03205 [Treponema phagedenis]|nr:hypothetical protein FUT79_03205 [Treponema phagedenis]QEK07763.1 hypothetical protein FUT80_14275 [Treponema phagedenis]
MLWLNRRHQCKNDVLKQNYLQSFKTRKVSFCHGRQNSERAQTPVVPNRSDVLKHQHKSVKLKFSNSQVWF